MMGKYCVRFKGFPIKGTSNDQPVDDDEEAVDVAGSEKKPKKKGKEPFAPEKAVVKNIFGVSDAKKEMIILDEKGSAKSGNYGHAGRAGKLGGSAPKAKGPVSGSMAQQDKPLTDDEVSELGREWTNVHVENLNDEFSKRGISNDNVDWDGVLMTVDGGLDHKSGQRGMMAAQNKINAAAAKAGFTVTDTYSDGATMSFSMEKKYPGHDAAMKDVGWDKPAAAPAKPAAKAPVVPTAAPALKYTTSPNKNDIFTNSVTIPGKGDFEGHIQRMNFSDPKAKWAATVTINNKRHPAGDYFATTAAAKGFVDAELKHFSTHGDTYGK